MGVVDVAASVVGKAVSCLATSSNGVSYIKIEFVSYF